MIPQLCLAALTTLAPTPAPMTQLPADQLPPLPTYTIARVAKAPAIDGVIKPGEWDAATPINLTYWWPQQTGPKDATTVRLLWDDENLYVCYDCVDHDIVATHGNHDDPTYKDDCCEIFIAPSPKRYPYSYIGLEMNARAVMYDYAITSGGALFRHFDLPSYQLAVHIDGTLNVRGDEDKGWQLEVAVPFVCFDDFGGQLPPKPGDIWRAQICRWNGVEPDRALSLWTHSGRKGPDPHNPERFGNLVFGG